MANVLTDRNATAGLSGRRAEVLDLLRRADAAMTVAEVAAHTGLHPNTARFHLDGLVEAGLVERDVEKREQPGRPRTLYAARPGSAPGIRSFQLLAEMMTGLVAAEVRDPRAAAVEAGRRWGRHLTERVAPYESLSATEATRRLTEMLTAIGFEPSAVPTDGGQQLRLHHCPFREVAERHQNVVCALHLGLMRGALEEMRAPIEARELLPLVEPSLCVADLRPVGTASGSNGSPT